MGLLFVPSVVPLEERKDVPGAKLNEAARAATGAAIVVAASDYSGAATATATDATATTRTTATDAFVPTGTDATATTRPVDY